MLTFLTIIKPIALVLGIVLGVGLVVMVGILLLFRQVIHDQEIDHNPFDFNDDVK